MTKNRDVKLQIAVVERDRERALLIVDGLQDAGEFDVSVIGDETGLARKLAALNPDVVLIDLENPSRDVLEGLTLASTPLDRPVAIFVDRSDADLMKDAIEAGVSAYVVAGLQKDRIKPVMDAAIARFSMVSRIRKELDATKAALAERKMVDRAKGLLMNARGLSEDEAYALLRRTAMDQGKKISEVASALITASELLK
ncbi:ANTAR domain-containing response regulator [Hwanghaeella sp.]|uniref:ANTAR domain-containing response regulator n=1 Tax=Hwanghaeella sp. TaxID=2605943 RepID=UPI003CCC3BAA